MIVLEMRPDVKFVNGEHNFFQERDWKSSNKPYYILLHFLYKLNVKFEIKNDTQVLVMRKFTDSIAIECDWWIHICIQFIIKDIS